MIAVMTTETHLFMIGAVIEIAAPRKRLPTPSKNVP